MKTLLSLLSSVLTLLLALAMPLRAQTAFVKHSIGLEVKPGVSLRSTKVPFVDTEETVSWLARGTKQIEITVRNIGRVDFRGHMVVFWFTRVAGGSGGRLLAYEPQFHDFAVPVAQVDSWAHAQPADVRDWLVVMYSADWKKAACRSSSGAIEDEFRRGLLDDLRADRLGYRLSYTLTPGGPRGIDPATGRLTPGYLTALPAPVNPLVPRPVASPNPGGPAIFGVPAAPATAVAPAAPGMPAVPAQVPPQMPVPSAPIPVAEILPTPVPAQPLPPGTPLLQPTQPVTK